MYFESFIHILVIGLKIFNLKTYIFTYICIHMRFHSYIYTVTYIYLFIQVYNCTRIFICSCYIFQKRRAQVIRCVMSSSIYNMWEQQNRNDISKDGFENSREHPSSYNPYLLFINVLILYDSMSSVTKWRWAKNNLCILKFACGSK